jgi:hypothetical protein
MLRDRGMLELGEDPRLPLEASDVIVVLVANDLQRDRLAGPAVQCAPDDAHPAFAGRTIELEAVGKEVAWEHSIEYLTSRDESRPCSGALAPRLSRPL